MGKKQPRDHKGKWTQATGGGWVRPEPPDVLPVVPTPQPKPSPVVRGGTRRAK